MVKRVFYLLLDCCVEVEERLLKLSHSQICLTFEVKVLRLARLRQTRNRLTGAGRDMKC